MSDNPQWTPEMWAANLEALRQLYLQTEAQLAAATKRAKAAEQALQLATNSTPGKGTGVWVPLEKWELQLTKMTEIEERVKAQMVQYAAVTAERDAATRRAEAADVLVTERTTVVEQLQMALHLRDTQLTAMTTERDDYRSKSRDLERELELERGQVVAVTAERDALQVGAGALVRLRDNTDSVLRSLKPENFLSGAINWGDLGVREVQHVTDDDRQWYRVIIEEADPSNPALHAAVLAGLMALGWTADDIEIETDW